jgi:hypothetical protein
MPDGTSRRLWILCVLCGAGVLAFASWFGGVIPTKTCTGPLPAGVSALVVYQLARTPAEIEAVFGAADDPCRPEMIAAIDRANTVDLAGFIATYGAFLACFFLALRQTAVDTLARAGVAAVGATVLFDALETSTQLYITGQLPGSAPSLLLLTIASRGKFLGLAAIAACAGVAMVARGKFIGRLAGAACILGGILVVFGLVSEANRAALGLGNAIAWLVMLLHAIQAAVRRAQ